jgi:hypothetical protein
LPNPPHIRDNRIDLLRGLALVMIFINHIPGTIWENATSRNFGFSDAAEGFVLMSGIAAGLAYGPAFLRGTPSLAATLRPWRRAFTIWWVHCLVTCIILAIFFAAFAQPGIPEMARGRNILMAIEDPATLLPALFTLGHHFGYADILPLYVVLLLAAPLLLFACTRAPWLTILASIALWATVGLLRYKMPTWPTDNGWSFNPMAWQVLFVGGLLTGLAMRQGRRLLPVNTWALRLALAFLVFAAIFVQVPMIGTAGGHGLWLLNQTFGLPPLFVSFDKSFVFFLRLVHILALAYALSVLPVVKSLAVNPRLAPLILLGRHSLPVFATGSVLAYAAQVIKELSPASHILDAALIVTGLCILLAVAHIRDGQRPRKTHLTTAYQ